jgi:hypothetical protein
VAKYFVSFGHSVEHNACRSLHSAMASCLSELQPSFAMASFPSLRPICHGLRPRSAKATASSLLKPRPPVCSSYNLWSTKVTPLVSNGLLFTIASPVASFLPWFLSSTVTAAGLPWSPFYPCLLSAIVTASGLPWPPFYHDLFSARIMASGLPWPPIYYGLQSSRVKASGHPCPPSDPGLRCAMMPWLPVWMLRSEVSELAGHSCRNIDNYLGFRKTINILSVDSKYPFRSLVISVVITVMQISFPVSTFICLDSGYWQFLSLGVKPH